MPVSFAVCGFCETPTDLSHQLSSDVRLSWGKVAPERLSRTARSFLSHCSPAWVVYFTVTTKACSAVFWLCPLSANVRSSLLLYDQVVTVS
jgi:hypothetical protein